MDIDSPNVEQDLHGWLPPVQWLLAVPHYILLPFLKRNDSAGAAIGRAGKRCPSSASTPFHAMGRASPDWSVGPSAQRPIIAEPAGDDLTWAL